MKDLFLFLLLVSCGLAHGTNRCIDNAICSVTIVHLISAPEKYHNKDVIVRGYFLFDDEQSHLFLDSEKSEHGLIEYSVRLDITKIDQRMAMERSGGYVLVQGIYDKSDQGRGIPTAGSIIVERLRLP